MANGNALRVLRQTTVVLIGAAFIAGVWQTDARLASWEEPIWVTVYPVVTGTSPQTQDYVDKLDQGDFQSLAEFIAREANAYGVAIDRPIRVDLGQPAGLPPAPPADGHPLQVAWWSLKLRWWAWRELAGRPGPAPDIRLFAVYHDEVTDEALPHSLGLKETRIGVAHLFASRRMAGANLVVLAHELLHTLGASDKYGPDNLPRYPEGYAEPDREPLFPQQLAEIMGGRIPVSRDTAEMPASLRQVRVGPATAGELRWLEPG